MQGNRFVGFRGWDGLELSRANRLSRKAQFRLDEPEIKPRRQALAITLDRRAPTLAGLIKPPFHCGEDGQVILNQH
jgi:hypothetical protein